LPPDVNRYIIKKISWHQPMNLLPVSIMTLILGSLLGFAIQKFGKDKDNDGE